MTTFQLKTTYYFGKNAIHGLNELINNETKNVLILYGGGSIKKNGVYDDTLNELKKFPSINIFEFSGIEPNPRHTTINQAVQCCQTNDIDLIIAVGGGSVIDASKVIAAVAKNEHIKDSWDYVKNPSLLKHHPIPIIAVLTISGTASENNGGSVITNEILKMKSAVNCDLAIPKAAILDPTYTYSLSKWQTSSGIFDCFSHLLEQYYSKETFIWTENYILANLKTLIQAANTICKQDFKDYDARANLMWTATTSLNSTTSFNMDGDWNVHAIEHSFSALYDITHGAGLALITPTYIMYRSCHEPWFNQKTLKLAKEIFNVETIELFKQALLDFIKMLALPIKYQEFKEINNISENDIDWLVNHTVAHHPSLAATDIKNIISEIVNK